jgi:hypothetical protein
MADTEKVLTGYIYSVKVPIRFKHEKVVKLIDDFLKEKKVIVVSVVSEKEGSFISTNVKIPLSKFDGKSPDDITKAAREFLIIKARKVIGDQLFRMPNYRLVYDGIFDAENLQRAVIIFERETFVIHKLRADIDG